LAMEPERMNLLIVNAGSSSLKLRVLDEADSVIEEKDVSDWDGSPDPIDAMAFDAVVHRVVHGGDRFDGAALVDDEVEAAIEELVSLAPLHQPRALELIRHTRSGDRPVVACFDTAYHRTIPVASATYALPAGWRKRFGLYLHRLVGEIARMVAALGGADAIAFTGGVGEHSAPLRAAVMRRLEWLGVVVDAEANESSASVISAPDSGIATCVIEAREDLTMAAQARAVLRSYSSGRRRPR
jgi:acetate kinase